MKKASHHETLDRIKKEQGVVPFNEQSPEQREEFVGRVKCLNVTNINFQLLLDNWAFVSAAIPDKKHSPKLYSQFKQIQESLKETLASTKMLNIRLMNLLASGNADSKETIESYSWYNKEIISLLLKLPQDRVDIAIEFINQLSSKNSIQAQSDDEYNQIMVDFGNYCLELASKGRKKITKNDFIKFNEKETK